MSGIGAVGGADKSYTKPPAKTIAKKEETVQSEPQDKLEVKKDISGARKVIEKVIGSPTGLVTMAANAFGGVFSGGAAAVRGIENGSEGPHEFMSSLGYVALGAGAGAMIGTPIVGGIVGGALGLGVAVLSMASGSTVKIADKIGAKGKKASSDNVPTESKIKDVTMNFTEGGVVGAIEGGKEGFKQGVQYGAGVVSGVIEGTKGFVGALAGTYETPEKKEKVKSKDGMAMKILKAVASVPRRALRAAAGTITGLAGAAMGIADGGIQGFITGASSDNIPSDAPHQVLRGIQIALAGVGAGIMIGGASAIALGAGAGILAAVIAGKISGATESGKQWADGVSKAVKKAQSDNVYAKESSQHPSGNDKNVYEMFRDGVEGTMTGIGAGTREGFKESYQIGSGIVDGVFDAGKGILKGVVGGVKGLVTKAENKEDK